MVVLNGLSGYHQLTDLGGGGSLCQPLKMAIDGSIITHVWARLNHSYCTSVQVLKNFLIAKTVLLPVMQPIIRSGEKLYYGKR